MKLTKCLSRNSFPESDTGMLKVKLWKWVDHEHINQKEAWMAILMSYKVELRTKKITREKEGHYILVRESIYQENTAILNVYAPNKSAAKYVK